MIHSVLSSLTRSLSEHITLSLGLREEKVVLSSLSREDRSSPPGKIVVSLVNIERETSAGIRFGTHPVNSGQYSHRFPAWNLNLYVLIAAVFPDKQYEDGLRLLSGAVHFLQSHLTFPVADQETPVAVEPVNLSFSEQSNLWAVCGNVYYPSVLCRVRMLSVDQEAIRSVVPGIHTQRRSYT